MYNRYIRNSDGNFCRQKVEEPKKAPSCGPPKCSQPQAPPPPPPPPKAPPKAASAGSFLQNLLPRDFDTGDLIVVLLLLLMAGDCEEDRNTALLTLALYLFL